MKQQGFSLIEVLVTLLLTAIGLLGMVAMQVKSQEYQIESIERNTAVTLANELIEVLRSHRDELYHNRPPEAYGYSHLKSDTVFYGSNGSPKFGASDCDLSTAKGQAGCVLKRIEKNLMGGRVERLCPSFNKNYDCATNYQGSTLMLKLSWDTREACPEPSTSSSEHNNLCTYTVRVEL